MPVSHALSFCDPALRAAGLIWCRRVRTGSLAASTGRSFRLNTNPFSWLLTCNRPDSCSSDYNGKGVDNHGQANSQIQLETSLRGDYLTLTYQPPCRNCPAPQTAAMATAAPRDLVALRDVIARDQLALQKWVQVVDHLVKEPGDVLRIKKMMKDGDFKEAVLQSLHVFFSGGGTTADLAAVLAGIGLNALEEQIQDPEAGRAPTQEAEIDPATAMWREVGPLIGNFIGRQVVIETLHKRLGDPENRAAGTASVVTISGLGGVGKSTLSRKYAYTHRCFYSGNVLWVNAETVDSMRASFIRLAKALGLQLGDQPPNALLMEKVFAHFQNKKWLLIFDNVENLTEFKQFLPEIRNPDHEMPYVLVTSRRTDLNALPANEIRLDVLTIDEAVALVLKLLPKGRRNDGK